MAWKIWLMALFFQVSARIKEREEKILCLAEMGSLDRSGVLDGSSLHRCPLLLILVNLIWRSPVFVQDQMSVGASFSYDICIQGLLSSSFAAV